MNTEKVQLDLTDLKPSLRVRSRLKKVRREPGVVGGPIEKAASARIVLIAATLIYIVIMGRHSLRSHWGFATAGFDLGIFDQGVWLLSRFEEPFVTIRGLHLFGDHTSFILLLMVPFYWIYPSAAVLLGAQTVALGVAAVPAFLIARDRLRNEYVAAAVAVAYLLHPAVGLTNQENFHPDSFQVPLILFAFLFMFRKQWLPYFFFLIAALLVKEDVPLLVFGIGMYVAFRLDRKIGGLTMLLATTWLLMNVFVILPGFSDAGSLYVGRLPLDNFGGLGGFVKAMLTRPWDIVAIAFERDRLWYLFQLLASFSFIPLARWGLLLVAAGPIALNVLSNFPYQYDIRYHYSTLIIPVLTTAAILGVARMRESVTRHIMVGLMVLASVISTLAWGAIGRDVAPDPDNPQAQAMRAALESVPDNAVVAAHYTFVPHLSHREEIYEFPVPWKAQNWGAGEQEGERLEVAEDVEVVVVPAEMSGDEQAILEEIRSDFSTLHDQGGILVLSRVRP